MTALVTLVWNQVGPTEWQAGGLDRHFSIIEADDGSYSMRQRLGDAASTRVGNFVTLDLAKAKAQRIIGG